MSLIDKIKQDREAGTPGYWQWNDPKYFAVGHGTFSEIAVYAPGNAHPWRMAEVVGPDDETAIANARRIARVPEMETALLAADELAAEMDRLMPVIAQTIEFHGLGTPYGIATANKARATLSAYRKAMGDAA